MRSELSQIFPDHQDYPVAWCANLRPADDFERPEALADATPLLMRLLNALGDDAVSRLLDVPRTAILRWRNGSAIEPAAVTRVLDMHDAFTRALQVFEPDVAIAWFREPEPYFYGATPLEVMDSRGLAPILDVLAQYRKR